MCRYNSLTGAPHHSFLRLWSKPKPPIHQKNLARTVPFFYRVVLTGLSPFLFCASHSSWLSKSKGVIQKTKTGKIVSKKYNPPGPPPPPPPLCPFLPKKWSIFLNFWSILH